VLYDFNRPHRTMEELQADQVWTALTPQGRSFVQMFIESGADLVFAARAYEMTDEACARKSAPGLLRRPAIAAALNFYFKLTPHELAIAELDRTIHKRGIPEATRLRAIEMKMEALGLKKPAAPGSEEAPKVSDAKDRAWKVGDAITVNGQRGYVTALGSDGQPTDFDPIEASA
jgi:hypothetical protein